MKYFLLLINEMANDNPQTISIDKHVLKQTNKLFLRGHQANKKPFLGLNILSNIPIYKQQQLS